MRNLVPEMVTDVRTIQRRDEDHGHSLAYADIQRLMDLLPQASAEVHAVAGELIRSSTARVEDLANGIFQLGNTLAEELKTLEPSNRDVQSYHQPPSSEDDLFLNLLIRSRLEESQATFTQLQQSHLQEVQQRRAFWQKQFDDSKGELCGGSQKDIPKLSPPPLSPHKMAAALGLPIPPPVPIPIVRQKTTCMNAAVSMCAFRFACAMCTNYMYLTGQ